MKNLLSAAVLLLACVFAPLFAQSNWTFTAAGTITALDRVKLDSNAKVVQCGSGDDSIGVCVTSQVTGDKVEVVMYSANDIANFKADGAITKGVDVYAGATGYASATVAGRRFGKALNTTVNAGDIVQVVIVAPIEYKAVTFNWSGAAGPLFLFTADKPYTVVSITEVHDVVAGQAGTVALRKITGVHRANAAVATGIVELLASNLDLTSTADTLVTASLSVTASDLNLATGDKIAFNTASGALTSLVGANITILLKAQQPQ